MFALAACQEELQQPVEEQKPVLEGIEGELQEVTFSVNLEDKSQTKAISDGLSADRLEYAVYYADDRGLSSNYQVGDYIKVLSTGKNAKIEKSGERTWKVTLTLAKNVKYDIVFWADNSKSPYVFDEENAQIIVKDNYTGAANAEIRDAFYGVCKGYSVISSDERVELRRPFAQINFGACDYIPYVTDLGLVVTSTIDTQAHDKVEAVYEFNDPDNGRLLYPERPAVAKCTVPNILNVLDGSVTGAVPVDFKLADIPFNGGEEDEVLLSAKTTEGETITYHWMGMNYILAGPEATINNIHATFHYNGQDLVFDVPNVPYKRNFKTNIIGNLFTENAKFNVVVLPDYFTPDIVIDLDELEALNPIERAIKLAVDGKLDDASVVLSADLELEETITVPAGLNLVLDLGGKTLTSSVAPAFLANGNVTMSNGNAQVAGEFVRAGAGAQITLTGVKAVSGTETVAGDNCVFVPKDATGAKVVIGEGTELKSYGAAAIQSNGNTQGLVLTVAGKVESVGDVAMYLPQVATCTIEGTAVISGATGIELRAGDLVIKDDAKISAGDVFEAKANGNGSTVLGAAVAVSAHSTNLPINVTIEGGVFSCAYALYEVDFNEGRTAATTLAVEDGTFNAPIYSENCTGFITGGTFAEKVEVPAAYLAEGLIVGEDGVVTEKPEPAIELAMVTTEVVPAEGGAVKVKVTANVAWTLALDGKAVKTGAAGESEVEVTVAANELEEVVEHTLTLSAEGVEAKTVKFNQAAAAPAGPTVVTVAEFLAAAEDETMYQLTGVITSVSNTTYGNFYLKDATGEVLIYGLCSPEGAQKYWAESGAKVGDTITVQTVRTSFNGAPQGKNAIFVELVPFVAQASEWGVVGDLNEWGKTPDIVMYNTWHTENLYVAYNVEIASGAFKIRANNEWNDAKNYGLEAAGSIYADKYYALKNGGDSKDASPMVYGTYDVYFDLANNRVALMTPGKAYAEAVDGGQPIVVVAGLKDHVWGLIGSFEASNGWSVDVEMAVEGDYAVAKNVTLANGDLFKIRSDKSWDTPNYGTGCEVNVGDVYTTYKSGDNMKFVGETGAYNLYFSLIDAKFHMEEYVEAPAETTAKVVMKDLGYANAAKVTTVKMDENVTLTFAKGKASTDPAYYTSGESVRLYQNGATLTVNANGKTIKSIKITFADNQYYIAADSGEFSAEGTVRTWTGAAESVKFTTTGTDKNHRAYVSAIEVTYE